jgi:hypothetical protein
MCRLGSYRRAAQPSVNMLLRQVSRRAWVPSFGVGRHVDPQTPASTDLPIAATGRSVAEIPPAVHRAGASSSQNVEA